MLDDNSLAILYISDALRRLGLSDGSINAVVHLECAASELQKAAKECTRLAKLAKKKV